ncbi:hypothetical protein HK097_010034 [Rhizophlyctis rosea]|uniref:Uncharacterized protein n=1 Tax=Rhizophlyctis rosea TaxID=64517 RepID=A0AAD5SAZ1_9FUNG|nr:hypothetical protein HK097_010034 [Rhizophlyctis rosea]
MEDPIGFYNNVNVICALRPRVKPPFKEYHPTDPTHLQTTRLLKCLDMAAALCVKNVKDWVVAIHANLQSTRTILTVASNQPLLEPDRKYLANLTKRIQTLANCEDASAQKHLSQLRSLVITYCTLKVQKNLRKGLNLLDGVTREVLKELWQKKGKEMIAEYKSAQRRTFDVAFHKEHGAGDEAFEKYLRVLVDKLENCKAAAKLAISDGATKRSLWQATKLAFHLHRSALFSVMLSFSNSAAGAAAFGWVEKVEKHLRKAGTFQLAIDTIYACCRNPSTAPFFRNIQSPPIIVEPVFETVHLADLRTAVESYDSREFAGFVQRLGLGDNEMVFPGGRTPALKGGPRFIVSGTHGEVYAAWAIPKNLAGKTLRKVEDLVDDLMKELVTDKYEVEKVNVDDSDMESIEGFSEFPAIHTTSEDDLTENVVDSIDESSGEEDAE